MAGKIVGWAFSQLCPSHTAKLVLVKLADNSNKDGYCWPFISTIVRQTGLAERTVRKNLGLLEQIGLVRIDRRTRGTRRTSNGYQLNLKPVDSFGHQGAVGLPLQVAPATDAPLTGTACPSSIRTVTEPPLNLTKQISETGDARAMETRITSLRNALGERIFDAWFEGVEFLEGPPAQVIVPRPSRANWIRKHYTGAVERIFGSDVRILAASERPKAEHGP